MFQNTATMDRVEHRKSLNAKGLFEWLASVKLSGGDRKVRRFKTRDLAYFFRSLATLTENGLSLPRSLETLRQERAMSRYSHILRDLVLAVESGEAFSAAMAKQPHTFGELLIAQVKVGERSGTLSKALEKITTQIERANEIVSSVLKKLAYPAILCVAGSGSVTFMLWFVVPTFEKLYKDSNAKLPWITQFLIACGDFLGSYGWTIPLLIGAAIGAWIYARRNEAMRAGIDAKLLRLPFVGDCIRGIAVMQFVETMGNLLDSGFTVAESLHASSKAVGNAAMRKCVEALHSSILRGERLSAELDRHRDMFPPVVHQLIVVGEKTGSLAKSASVIQTHLRREIDRTLAILVGAIEPILTISLAIVIGVILLAIYLPMFDMIGAMNGMDR